MKDSLRKQMVRIAGMPGQRWLPLAIRLEMMRAQEAFGRALASRLWGQPGKKTPVKLVGVPRRLRARFGRYVQVQAIGGRKRKNRRRHNRRWMPKQECDCP